MPEEILISGNTVELRVVNITKTVPIELFKNSLATSFGVETPIIPRKAIYYKAFKDKTWFLTELEPGIRVIKYRPKDTTLREFKLAFPWTYFLSRFINRALDRLFVFFSPSKLNDIEDMLYHAPITNLNSQSGVCLGNGLRFNIEGNFRIKLTRLENYFFESEFNRDIPQQYENKMPREIKEAKLGSEIFYETWHRLTEAGISHAAFTWEAYETLEEIMEEESAG